MSDCHAYSVDLCALLSRKRIKVMWKSTWSLEYWQLQGNSRQVKIEFWLNCQHQMVSLIYHDCTAFIAVLLNWWVIFLVPIYTCDAGVILFFNSIKLPLTGMTHVQPAWTVATATLQLTFPQCMTCYHKAPTCCKVFKMWIYVGRRFRKDRNILNGSSEVTRSEQMKPN